MQNNFSSRGNLTFPYDGISHKPTATATNLYSSDVCVITVDGAKVNAGSYTATASALSNSNYALLGRILPGTELYSYVRDSRDAMIWASATEVHYDELTFADFSPVGDNCCTCTIRYKGDFAATAWHESYNYEMQNAYELSFVRVGDIWYAAAMSVVAG